MNPALGEARCYDSATGRVRLYVRVRYWRGLWKNRVVLAKGQS